MGDFMPIGGYSPAKSKGLLARRAGKRRASRLEHYSISRRRSSRASEEENAVMNKDANILSCKHCRRTYRRRDAFHFPALWRAICFIRV